MAILCSECGAQVAKPVVTGRGPMLCAKCEAKKRAAANGPASEDENMPTLDAPPPGPSPELERPPHSQSNRALAGSPTRPMPSRPPSARASQPPRNYAAPTGARIPMGSTPPPRGAPRPSTFPLAPNAARPSNAPPAPAPSASSPHANAPNPPNVAAPARSSGPAIPRPGALPAGMPAARPAPSAARRPPGPPTDHEMSSEFDPVGTGELEVVRKDDDAESLGTGDIEIDPPPRPKKR